MGRLTLKEDHDLSALCLQKNYYILVHIILELKISLDSVPRSNFTDEKT